MGWNAYQIAFYNSKFKNLIATDVIPDVVENGNLLHNVFKKYQENSIFESQEKTMFSVFLASANLSDLHILQFVIHCSLFFIIILIL